MSAEMATEAKPKATGKTESSPTKTSQPFKMLGVRFAPLSIPLERRMQTFAVFFYMSMFLFLPMMTMTVSYVLLFHTANFRWIPILYAAWIFYDLDTGEKGGRKHAFMKNWCLLRYFKDFFPAKLVKTADLDPEQSYLICSHPHGILCYGAYAAFGGNFLQFDKIFPGLESHIITLKQNFWLPGIREMALASGMISSSKESLNYVLREKSKGYATVLVLGGVSEAMDHGRGDIRLTMNKRRGFVKYAMQHGRPLVPTFTFGENFLYDNPVDPNGWIRRLQEWSERTLAFSPVVFGGRGIFQYNWGIVPFRRPLTVVVGSPVTVPKRTNPTQEEVTEYHGRYVAALQTLYDEYNPTYGDPKVKLVVE